MNRREFFLEAARWVVLAAAAAVGAAGVRRGKIALTGSSCPQSESCRSCAEYPTCGRRLAHEPADSFSSKGR